MRMQIRWMFLLALVSLPCFAQNNSVRDLFQAILSSGAKGALPAEHEFFSKVNENTVGALSVAEINAVLPLARQCIQSSRPEVGQYGLVLFLAITTRADSSTLLSPYIDDLGALLNGPEGAISLRHGALYVLGSTKPDVSPKAIAYLNAHLADDRNSNEETLTIAASLLQALPSDAVTQRRTFAVVDRRADPGLTGSVIRQLGLIRARTPEALAFLEVNLSHPDIHVRESAVDAVSRLDADVRSRFAGHLARMATDPNESEHARALARIALHQDQQP